MFGDVFRKVRRSVFGVRNISVDAMRTAQDTLVVEHGQELGLPKENYACTLLRSTITTRPLVSADMKKLMSRVRIPRWTFILRPNLQRNERLVAFANADDLLVAPR